MTDAPALGWSDFALKRHSPATGYTFFVNMTTVDVIELVRNNWHLATPGDGETDLSRKILVPIPADNFYGAMVPLEEGMILQSEVSRRQDNEDWYVRTTVSQLGSPAKFVKVVCYSADALLENDGERSCDLEWEIVCILASDVEKEPMPPLTMARNMLEKVGGTKSEYTAQEFAESIYYWSQYVAVKSFSQADQERHQRIRDKYADPANRPTLAELKAGDNVKRSEFLKQSSPEYSCDHCGLISSDTSEGEDCWECRGKMVPYV